MTAQKISQELVFKLADQLVLANRKPSAMLIRELNGHYGSPNEITRWLKAWREARADSATAAPMPEEKLLALLSPVWLELTQAATDQHETERQQWVDQQAESAAELARHIHTIETQATQLDAAEADNQTLRDKQADLRKQYDACQQLLQTQGIELTQTQISLQTATEATELASEKYEMQGVELQRVRSSLALADTRQNDSVAELTRLRTRLEESERAASQQTAGITKLLDQQAEHHNRELARRDDQLAALQEKLLALAAGNNPC